MRALLPHSFVGRLAFVTALGAFASVASVASAADPVVAVPCFQPSDRCERATITVSKTETIPIDFDYDSGWLPNGSPLQVRLVSFLHGRTRVDLTGTLDATWPDALTLRAEGTTGAGLLGIDDGIVVKALGRIHVKVAGQSFDWEGPLPAIPSVDLQAVQQTSFDPFAWKGNGAPPFVSAKTGKITLAKYPITASIIPIPGISGGFDLDGQGEFSASYVSTRIAFDEHGAPGVIGDVLPSSAFSRALLDATGTSFDTVLTVHGELTRGLTLHFIPGFYVEILGQKFEMPIVDVPAPLPSQTTPFAFDDVPVHVPLPKIDVAPKVVDLGIVGVGAITRAHLDVYDLGQARLVVDASSKAASLDVAHLSIEGGYSGEVVSSITPTSAGPFDAIVTFASNDPRAPTTTVHLKGVAVAGASGGDIFDDGGTSANGSCGCQTPGEHATNERIVALAAAIGLLVARRRKR